MWNFHACKKAAQDLKLRQIKVKSNTGNSFSATKIFLGAVQRRQSTVFLKTAKLVFLSTEFVHHYSSYILHREKKD